MKDYSKLSKEQLIDELILLGDENLILTSLNEKQAKQLDLYVVGCSLPSTKEIESRLKHVVDESFEDYEVVEKREYSLGFRACYNWLKIKQMKK